MGSLVAEVHANILKLEKIEQKNLEKVFQKWWFASFYYSTHSIFLNEIELRKRSASLVFDKCLTLYWGSNG